MIGKKSGSINFNAVVMAPSKLFEAHYTPIKSGSLEDTTKDKSFNKITANIDTVIGGKRVKLFELKNKQGIRALVTNYGARLLSLFIADKNGKMIDVIQGTPSAKDFQNLTENDFETTVGNFGDKAAKGKFVLNSWIYKLYFEDSMNAQNGGKKGPHDTVWDGSLLDQTTVEFTYLTTDMEGGLPRDLRIKVIYSLTEDNSLKISYDASTDKTKSIDLTNHAFFNLNGENSGNILNHRVQIKADHFSLIASTLVPTGQIKNVTGTPFDFRRGFTIGSRINDHSDQLYNGKGYYHNYVLNKHSKNAPVAKVSGDESGITMEIFTDQPGLQFNSGHIMYRRNTMKQGYNDAYCIAFVMSSQNFPDSPNQTKFPSTILRPGQRYYSMTKYHFKVN